MTQYICTAHHCGGSTSEAVEPQYIWGPFPTYKNALNAGTEFHQASSTAYGDDWMLNITKIPDIPVPTVTVLAQYKKDYN